MLAILISLTRLHAQDVFTRLAETQTEIPEIVQYNPQLEPYFKIQDAQAPYMNGILQHLVKTRYGLFLLIDGTGRVYKVDTSGSTATPIRYDSTLFFGYNFGFQPFAWRDTLFSFGGYGYWKHNGHVRVFLDGKREWEIEQTNREVPFTRVEYPAAPHWINIKKDNLWIGYTVHSHEGIRIRADTYRRVVDSVYVIDLRTKTWSARGRLNDNIRVVLQTQSSRSLGSCPWGQLIHHQEKSAIYLLDYSHNELLVLSDVKAKSIVNKLQETSILFFEDSTLFIGVRSAQLDSVALERADFQKSDLSLYESADVPLFGRFDLTKTLLVAVSLSGLVILVGFFVRRRKSTETTIVQVGDNPLDLFEEREIEVVRFVFERSELGVGTRIDELNKILGVESKNIEIQKKQRSDILLSINRKWGYKTNGRDLIEKRRLEVDKRSFEYYIEYPSLSLIRDGFVSSSRRS